MTNILNASAAVIKPYSVGNLAATITCLKIDDDGNAKVKWSATLNGTARTASHRDPSDAATWRFRIRRWCGAK